MASPREWLEGKAFSRDVIFILLNPVSVKDTLSPQHLVIDGEEQSGRSCPEQAHETNVRNPTGRQEFMVTSNLLLRRPSLD